MQDSQKWRELLGILISDPSEKKRLVRDIGVRSITLDRWVSGESMPRMHNLRQLIDAFPEYRNEWLALLPDEYIQCFQEVEQKDKEEEQEIPPIFYARVLSDHCNLPRSLHFTSLCDVVLQQALSQLDPKRVGIEITIVQCMPPVEEQKIRSLRESLGRGTGPWNRELEEKTLFLGSESLAGYVVTTGRPLPIQNRKEGEYHFPAQWVDGEESAMAYPIMRADLIAGCLLVSCRQPNYFVSQARQKLIQYYAELLTIIFDPTAFYTIETLELGRMPEYTVQRKYITSFRQRVSHLMLEQHMGIIEAELLVWKQIEQELLKLS